MHVSVGFILSLSLISFNLHVVKVGVERKIVKEWSFIFGYERNIFIRRKSSQALCSDIHRHLYNDQVIIQGIVY